MSGEDDQECIALTDGMHTLRIHCPVPPSARPAECAPGDFSHTNTHPASKEHRLPCSDRKPRLHGASFSPSLSTHIPDSAPDAARFADKERQGLRSRG
jgi:hypothetical protein